jgi:regulator of RNase E activity RraA
MAMSTTPTVSPTVFSRLQSLDTCTVANAIEQLNVRLRNEGFVHGASHCFFPELSPLLAYAVTGVIQSSTEPVTGGYYYDRIEWWETFQDVPAPRVMVLQDADRLPGFGAFVGSMHAHIAAALGCIGCVTNGVTRDLPAMQALGFHIFASGVSPSHAYAHIVEWGGPVEIGGLKISPGDLVHGDRHGIHTIPIAEASKIPPIAQELESRENELIALCRSKAFSLSALSALFDRLRSKDKPQTGHRP